MKTPTTSAILSVAALGSYTYAAVTMNIAKNPEAKPKTRRGLLPRASTVTESLQNNATGGDYIAQVNVGTPAQMLTLLLDTGSSDVWMLAASADLCTDPQLQDQYQTGGCSSTFDQTKSSTYKVAVKGGFSIQYADQSGAGGDYITDTFSIGGATIKALEMGLAYNSSSSTGVLGIGYDVNEASSFTYPSIIDTMVSQGLINSKAYSLYLDDLEASTGSIIFGGLDSDKYHGNLLQVPIIPDTLNNGSKIYAEFSVAMSGFSITSDSGTTTNLTTASYEEAAILDSGTTVTYLPDSLVAAIIKDINAYNDTQNSGNIYVDCAMANNASMTFNYQFGSDGNAVNIKVPANELVFQLDGAFSLGGYQPPNTGFSSTCAFGILPGSPGPYILGDTFLRSAYVVYDLKNNLIALAQTNFNSTTSSIVNFQASATAIPNVSGVASSATISQTATGVVGSPNGPKTTAHTGTGSSASATGTATGTGIGGGSSTATTSKSAGVASVPAFDARGLIVLGISTVFTIFGAGLVLA